MYLRRFVFPDSDQEFDFFRLQKRTCYSDFYPFQVLAPVGLAELTFEPLTILHGGNGCGKTTALNVMAEYLRAKRDAAFNRSAFFSDYVRLCRADRGDEEAEECRILTSDDVFDYMLDLRGLNEGIDRRREELFAEYLDRKYADFHMRSLEDYDELKRVNESRRRTQSRYVRENLMENVRERSNGESAFACFTERIGEHGLYFLDEPENSLAPGRQQELADFLSDAVRYFGCQLVISTHSPFLLALPGARVYDMDSTPPTVRRWTQLENVRQYYSFFREHAAELEGAT